MRRWRRRGDSNAPSENEIETKSSTARKECDSTDELIPDNPAPSTIAEMSVKSSKPLNEKLLSLLKEQTSFHDCIVLKCRDSEERRAHRAALIASSSYFSTLLQEDPMLESIDVPYTGEVMDLVIGFLYSSTVTTVTEKLAIQLYCAAKAFALEDLRNQVAAYFEYSMYMLLKNESFLTEETEDDMSQMIDVFKAAKLTARDKLLLITRVLRWGEHRKVSSDFIIDLLNSVVASTEIAPPEEINPQARKVSGTAPGAARAFDFFNLAPGVGGKSGPAGTSPSVSFSFGAKK